MAEIRNYTMNFSSGVTPALRALASTEIHCESAFVGTVQE
jgi:hypothetical protein